MDYEEEQPSSNKYSKWGAFKEIRSLNANIFQFFNYCDLKKKAEGHIKMYNQILMYILDINLNSFSIFSDKEKQAISKSFALVRSFERND